jgi:hypothetical protein
MVLWQFSDLIIFIPIIFIFYDFNIIPKITFTNDIYNTMFRNSNRYANSYYAYVSLNTWESIMVRTSYIRLDDGDVRFGLDQSA